MKKRRISKINSFVMIMLIISFLVGFCGVGALFDSKKEYETTEKVSTIVDDSNIIPDCPQSDDKDNVQPVSATEYVEKSLEDYFTDNNISSKISDTTITGTGTKDDPYVLHSGADMYYFNTYGAKGNTYIELGNDIILNDEIFDGEGDISGGDGVIYNWSPIMGSSFYFDGKGHKIKGLYLNYPEEGSYYKGFFYSAYSVKNLKFENYYVCTGGNYLGVIANGVATNGVIDNCHVGKGVIRSTLGYAVRIGGIAGGMSEGTIKNCTSRATFIFNSNTACNGGGGIVGSAGANAKIINCKNYSDIYGKRTIGGIAGGINNNCEIIDCENYGDIITESNNYYGGGITGECSNSCIIRNCKNYGKTNGGGIAGQPGTSLLIQKCENYGEALNGIYGCYSSSNTYVMVDNCANYDRSSTHYFGYAYNADIKNCHVTIYQDAVGFHSYSQDWITNIRFINCKIKIDKSAASQIFISKAKNVTIRNCEITTHSNVLIDTSSVSNVKLNNVIWNTNNEVAKICRIVSNEANLTNFEKNSVIVHNYDESSKTYDNSFYGSNFKDFYISWKTGKIGLTQLDGTGAFQDIVNVTKLKSLGYTWEDDLQDSTYTQLEYIESTGEQYIDTGVVITNQNFNSLRIEIDAVMDVDGMSSGWQLNGTVGAVPYCGLGLNNGFLCYGNGTGIQTTYAISMTTKKKERHLYVMDYKNKTLSIDGQKITDCIVADLTTRSFSANFYIFATNSNGATNYTKSKQHSVKMYVNDKLVRDFIPVVRDADGKVCMYDLVEKKFYVNFGTGSFVAGAAV